MNKHMLDVFTSIRFSFALTVSVVLLVAAQASAQCPAPELISGLRRPIGITQSNQGNLIVSETGTPVPNTGRISIVDVSGNRRTLLDGLPSGISDVGDPSGPDGLFLRGRTLYVAIGVGDVGRAGPIAGTTIVNPNPISSPIFSSILAIHFSADVEKTTGGFTLTLADQQTLASGDHVTLSNGGGDSIMLQLIADFPNYTANPLPFFAANIRLSNPFGVVVVGDQLYVTDGGQNSVRQVDIPTGSFSTLVSFPTIPNPLPVGPPVVEAVPTGIRYFDGQLLVALFRGVPFPPGSSVVEQVDPGTGSHTPFISGRKTAIDVLPVLQGDDVDYLVLQHAAATGPFFPPPGSVLRFETPGASPTVVADCLTRPTSMTLDKKTGTLYVTELGGSIVTIALNP
jgi:hypothetical protein